MADHLNFPSFEALPTKRGRGFGEGREVDYAHRATTLRGVLEGLESASPGLFTNTVEDEASDEIDAANLGEIVLKFTGYDPFDVNKGGLFKEVQMTRLAANSDHEYFVLSDAHSRSLFRELAMSYTADIDGWTKAETWKQVLQNISGIDLYDREDRIPEDLPLPQGDGVTDISIALWPTSLATHGAARVGAERVQALADIIARHGQNDPRVQVLAKDDTNTDTLLIHARLNSAAFDDIVGSPYVERLHGPLTVEVTRADLAKAPEPADVILPEGAAIGIIDDLVVDTNPWLAGVVVEQRSFPASYPFGDHTRHGTQVAGLAAWGNLRGLLDPNFDGQPHPLFVARIAQMNSEFEAQVVGNASQQISDALDWLASEGVKVIVLALGHSYADDGAIPSELASVVDRKAHELGLVIVTPAGNLTVIAGHWKNDYPNYHGEPSAKIAAPGSAALAVTVGSVAHTDKFDQSASPHGVRIAAENAAVPYTRTGPSRATNKAGRQKPEFAAHGGGWAYDQSTDLPIREDPTMGTITLIPPVNGRLFAAASGTSYAAPLVAHEIARIHTRYPDASSNQLRALTALAGVHAPSTNYQDGENIVGLYGIPNADTILESGGNRVTFVYDGEMPTNRHFALEIPIPTDFAAGSSTRELRVALAFDPPVRRSRRDYIAGRMDFELLVNTTIESIREVYARQLPVAERVDESDFHERLPERELRPPKTRLNSDTLICRSYVKNGWNEDDTGYYLVVTHSHSPWSSSQKNSYKTQKFAVAVQILDIGRPQVDLYALAQARIAGRVRGRGENT